MDSTTTTEDLLIEAKTFQDDLLLDIVKEIGADDHSVLCPKLIGKVTRIIAECDLSHYSGLHRLSSVDETTSTVLGLMNHMTTELTYDEQAELNEAIIKKIETKIPSFISELNQLKATNKGGVKNPNAQMRELQQSLDEKMKILEDQESEKVELMMQWLNHRLQEVISFKDNSGDLLTLKTKILELKSKILHLQILQNIFTETNQSIKAYSEIHKDLKESIKDSEQRIKNFKQIIANDED